MRFIGMVIIILSAFFITSRLQVNENARFITKQGEVLEGRVSRDFVTGQYKIETVNGSIRYASQENLGAMSFEGSSIPDYAGVIGFLLILVAGIVGLNLNGATLQVFDTRSRNADKAIAKRQTQLEESVREQMRKGE